VVYLVSYQLENAALVRLHFFCMKVICYLLEVLRNIFILRNEGSH